MAAAKIRALLAQHGATEKAIGKLIDLWMERLWLKHWTIDVTYEWNGIGKSDGQGNSAFAQCTPRWEYQMAHVTFDLPLCSTLSHEKLSRVVCHELLHVVVNEMRDEGIKHEERVVTQMEDVMTWAYRKRVRQ